VELRGSFLLVPIKEKPSTDIRTRLKGATNVAIVLASLVVLVLSAMAGMGKFGRVMT
jgi:hypothetical protein